MKIYVSTNQEIRNCFHCINTFFKLCVQVILGLSGGECVCTSMQAMPVGSMYPISIELPHHLPV